MPLCVLCVSLNIAFIATLPSPRIQGFTLRSSLKMAALRNPALKLLNLFCVLRSGFQAEPPFLSFRARLGFHDMPVKPFAPYGCKGHARPGTIHLIFGSRRINTFQIAELHGSVNFCRVANSPFVAFCSTESEKCHFRFPYKSMIFIASH